MGYKLADGSDSEQYKIGDKFEVVSGDYRCLLVNLENNDGSANPFFLIGSNDRYCFFWSQLKPHHKPFTKSDLKDGMLCQRRDGFNFYVNGGYLVEAIGDSDPEFYSLKHINDDLTTAWIPSNADIMRVIDRDGTVVFEREPEKKKVTIELTDEQIESLKQQGIIED